MEQIKTFKFSDNQMRDLYAHIHSINEKSRMLESFIKDQEGRNFTAEDASNTLSLLGNNVGVLKGELLTINQQVENWTNSLRPHLSVKQIQLPVAMTLRDFFTSQGVADVKQANLYFNQANAYALKKNGQKKYFPISGEGTKGSPFTYLVSDLQAYMAGLKVSV